MLRGNMLFEQEIKTLTKCGGPSQIILLPGTDLDNRVKSDTKSKNRIF